MVDSQKVDSQKVDSQKVDSQVDPQVDSNLEVLIQAIKEDYAHFPYDQRYELYAADFYFRDPMTEIRGQQKFQAMICWFDQWFKNLKLDLHEITATADDQIQTQWTLSWTVPVLPWHPAFRVDGWSEFRVNEAGLLQSQIDYWKCTKADVFKQLVFRREPSPSL